MVVLQPLQIHLYTHRNKSSTQGMFSVLGGHPADLRRQPLLIFPEVSLAEGGRQQVGELVPLLGSSETRSPQAGDPAHSLGARLKCRSPPPPRNLFGQFPVRMNHTFPRSQSICVYTTGLSPKVPPEGRMVSDSWNVLNIGLMPGAGEALRKCSLRKA